MKRSIILIFAIIILFSACNNHDELPIVTALPEIVPEYEFYIIETQNTQLLTSLNLLGYTLVDFPTENDFINEDTILILKENWTDDFTPDDYRRYFFGTWEATNRTMTIDDTEENRRNINLANGGYYKTENNAIVRVHFGNAGYYHLYWVDCDNPEFMYFITTATTKLPEVGEVYFFNPEWEISELSVFKKLNTQINQPQNNYISELRLNELSIKHGIDFNMLISIKYGEFSHGHWQDFYPIYLISEETDKFIFKTRAGWAMAGIDFEIIYTIEKIDGEWVRTVEANQEQYEIALAEVEKFY